MQIFSSADAQFRTARTLTVVENTPLDFESWYSATRPRLIAALTASFGSVDLATECADEALVRAIERWERVTKMQAPNGWVYRVALNAGRRSAKRSRRELDLTLAAWYLAGQAGYPDPEIWMVVGDLPERQRTAVVLRHVAGLTEREIASAMTISRGGVSSTLRAAYGRLRENINHERASEDVDRPRA